MDIVIASSNTHKIREFRQMFRGLSHIDIYSLRDFPDYQEAEETGETFEENAKAKASNAAKKLKKIVISDDSGLVVPKLGGAPGVYSRRYAGVDATDADNRKKLLKDLEGMHELDRSAYFECCIAVASEDWVKTFTGRCEGEILKEEKGSYGFGYDSLFRKYGYEQTFAELEESIKNKVSHRAKAFEKLKMFLESLKSLRSES